MPPEGAPGCPICGHQDSRRRFEINGYEIHECDRCAHGVVRPLPAQAELESLYARTDDSLLGNGLARQVADIVDAGRGAMHFRERQQRLRASGVDPGHRVLDFGCANGAFVEALYRAGFRTVTGFDVSNELVSEGKARWRRDLHTGDVADFLDRHRAHFDAVMATNVFEHLLDPVGTLETLVAMLARGGRVLISVPNFRSLQVAVSGTRSPIIDPPHHIQYFTPTSLRGLLERRGLTVTAVETSFWSVESDPYLATKGIPRWGAAILRCGAAIPGGLINAFSRGGVVHVAASCR